MQFLSGLDLPGNVRQLENLCNWITVMAPGQTVEVKDLPPELTQGQRRRLGQRRAGAGRACRLQRRSRRRRRRRAAAAAGSACWSCRRPAC